MQDQINRVEGALVNALTSVSNVFDIANSYATGAQVVEGCPPPTAALGDSELNSSTSSEFYTDLIAKPVRIWAPDAPSQHRAFVYFIPEDIYLATFGTKPYARVTCPPKTVPVVN